MNTTKFKAWNESSKQMIDGDMLFMNGESDGGTNSLQSTLDNLQKNYTLLQFWGLLDKNGKEIYIGHILKNEGHETITEVKWIDEFACIAAYCPADGNNYFYQKIDEKKIEIIGNIYENPDLLKF